MKKIVRKVFAVVLEIIQTVAILCWALYSPIWTCMIAYNAACYVNYGEVATPKSIMIIATILFAVNVIWLNHMIDKAERKEERNNG